MPKSKAKAKAKKSTSASKVNKCRDDHALLIGIAGSISDMATFSEVEGMEELTEAWVRGSAHKVRVMLEDKSDFKGANELKKVSEKIINMEEEDLARYVTGPGKKELKRIRDTVTASLVESISKCMLK